jgi:hypothetical protein
MKRSMKSPKRKIRTERKKSIVALLWIVRILTAKGYFLKEPRRDRRWKL